MDKKDILKDLEKSFEEIQKELKFKSTFQDIDKIFFISDAVLREGFVSENFSRQLCSRIVETYIGWTNYLHSLIMPNPQNILNISESKVFSNEEKEEMKTLMKKGMFLSSKSSWIGLTKDKTEEAKFIDEAVEIWKTYFGLKITKILEKIKEEWKQ